MNRWPHYDHVFFDCDSTLTTIEGIDILAESAGKKWRVEVLTNAAMDGTLDLEEIYAKRLQAIRPTREQVLAVRQAYKRHIVEDAALLVTALQSMGHKVYIISGGLAEPVEEFGVSLGIPRERVRAVGLTYNELSGRWWEQMERGAEQYLTFEEGALTVSNGKADVVAQLLGQQRGRSLLIGDGNSDLLAGAAVDLFVGFGGVIARPKVVEGAPVFIHSSSLAPLVALAGGPPALRRLHADGGEFGMLADKAVKLIHGGAVTFRDEGLEARFNGAVAAYVDSISLDSVEPEL